MGVRFCYAIKGHITLSSFKGGNMFKRIRYNIWILRAIVYGASYAIWTMCRHGVTKGNQILDEQLTAQVRLNRNRYSKMKSNYEHN